MLEFANQFSNICTELLEDERFRLLHDILDISLSSKSAQRNSGSVEEVRQHKNMLEGGLYGEVGSHTGFPIDGLGLDTWITVQEGKLVLFWFADMTDEDRAAWRKDRFFNNGKVRYVIVRAGPAIFIPVGTIYAVARLETTYAIAGHFLQWSNTNSWLEIVKEQRPITAIRHGHNQRPVHRLKTCIWEACYSE
jgi:hypothetical protein